jgi:hypothetical protein
MNYRPLMTKSDEEVATDVIEAGEEAVEQAGATLLDSARAHPIATGSLAACFLLGAALGFELLPESLSATRRVLGGALSGGGCWLLVQVGRILD